MKVRTVQQHEWAINDVIPLHQILAILYKGGEAAQQESRLLGTIENQVCLLSALTFGGSSKLSYSSICVNGSRARVMNSL